MRPHPPSRFVLAVLFSLLLVVSGCGGGGDGGAESSSPRSQTGSDGKEATIDVDGSSTVYRISKIAQEAYADVAPKVTVVVNKSGTGGGFGKYLQGEIDIVDASRDAKPEEAAKAKAQGIEWTRFLVGYDGITLVTNPKNEFAKSLTTAKLKAIWSPESAVKTWKDVDPTWPDRSIALYSPDNDSGTFEYFTEAIVGKKKSQREDVQQNSDDNILVNGVAGDPDGLGYFGYAYFASNQDKLRALAESKLANLPFQPPCHWRYLTAERQLARSTRLHPRNGS